MTRHFFGYGSLVNSRTHDFTATPAKLTGWRRTWCATAHRDAAFLSVDPDPDTTLLGVTAPVPGSSWEALDAREAAYVRIDVSDQFPDQQFPDQTVVYSVPQASKTDANQHTIWLSYLDVVLQGYLHVFGPDGPRHFMDTTDGWNIGITNDRATPRYPRAQQLTTTETFLVNALTSQYWR